MTIFIKNVFSEKKIIKIVISCFFFRIYFVKCYTLEEKRESPFFWISLWFGRHWIDFIICDPRYYVIVPKRPKKKRKKIIRVK